MEAVLTLQEGPSRSTQGNNPTVVYLSEQSVDHQGLHLLVARYSIFGIAENPLPNALRIFIPKHHRC